MARYRYYHTCCHWKEGLVHFVYVHIIDLVDAHDVPAKLSRTQSALWAWLQGRATCSPTENEDWPPCCCWPCTQDRDRARQQKPKYVLADAHPFPQSRASKPIRAFGRRPQSMRVGVSNNARVVKAVVPSNCVTWYNVHVSQQVLWQCPPHLQLLGDMRKAKQNGHVHAPQQHT